MNGLLRFAAFWYDFIVGDDWRLAVGALVGLGLTALLAHVVDIPAWWVLPVVVLGMLGVSVVAVVRREARHHSAPP